MGQNEKTTPLNSAKYSFLEEYINSKIEQHYRLFNLAERLEFLTSRLYGEAQNVEACDKKSPEPEIFSLEGRLNKEVEKNDQTLDLIENLVSSLERFV